jgi:hypothetical protein
MYGLVEIKKQFWIIIHSFIGKTRETVPSVFIKEGKRSRHLDYWAWILTDETWRVGINFSTHLTHAQKHDGWLQFTTCIDEENN